MDPQQQNNPTAVLGEINRLLAQAVFLALHYSVLTGRELPAIPESVSADPPDAVPAGGIVYLASGLTAPRADGAVRARAWDDAVARALASDDVAEQRWGAENAARPWIFIQDTLGLASLDSTQRNTVLLNCANCRFLNGLLGKGDRFGTWTAAPLVTTGGVARLADQEISDAFSVSSDMTRADGTTVWTGVRAVDIDTLAKRSLAHYIMTSGRANKPLTGNAPFGQGKRP